MSATLSRRTTMAGLVAALTGAIAGPALAHRDFIVYFDLDNAAIPNDGMAAVTAAADYGQALEARGFYVIGHAQDSGSPEQNLILSLQRADAVADALVTAGIDRRLIRVEAMGDTQPAVATESGVLDPLNRYVAFSPDINYN